jgi:hypothetical protein
MISSRTLLSCLLAGTALSTLGCATIWHEVQPHRMMKWNNGPAPSLDPEFSSNRRDDSTQSLAAVQKLEANVVRGQSPN